jgi:hypothetical protein
MPDLNLPHGWRTLSIEDRGLLLTLVCSSELSEWVMSPLELSAMLGVNINRAQQFIYAAVTAEVLIQMNGMVVLADDSNNLRKYWERQFEETFWAAVDTPWKKVGKANAKKAWMTKTFALIKPKTEAAADELCKNIMSGVELYKKLLRQPNAPAMKYPEGWLSGQRWSDEIDDQFIEKHTITQAKPAVMSPLERARKQQAEQHQLIEHPSVIQSVPAIQAPVLEIPSRQDELPEFTVAL